MLPHRMKPTASKLALLATCATLLVAGCKPSITLGKLREKNRAAIDTGEAAYAAMERAIAAAPAPPVGGSCSRPGLGFAPAFSFNSVKAGSPGDATELMDAAYLTKHEHLPPPNGLFETNGPVEEIVSDARNDQIPVDIELDPVKSQVKYDEAGKIRYILVSRVASRNPMESAETMSVFLFEYPKATLICGFSLDVSADRKFAEQNGYDPHTGEPARPTGSEPADMKALFSQALFERFGLGAAQEARLADDSRVKLRAETVSKALDAAPAELPECAGDAAKHGLRLNKKGVRILAGGPLLERMDPTVQIDPTSSATAASYLTQRDKTSADALVSADTWNIVEVQSGGTAASIDNKTFIGGSARGRLVVIDKTNHPTCQVAFRIAPPKEFEAKVSNGTPFLTNDVSKVSAHYLRKSIDESLGAP